MNAAEQQRSDVQAKRLDWLAEQEKLDADKLVFIDETWLKTNMTRTRGRALRGKRLIEYVPFGHWKTTTFIAGLRTTGMIAPMVISASGGGILRRSDGQARLDAEAQKNGRYWGKHATALQSATALYRYKVSPVKHLRSCGTGPRLAEMWPEEALRRNRNDVNGKGTKPLMSEI